MLSGWLLNVITFGKLSTALIYETVVFIGYALPACTFYYVLRHLGFERRAAFVAGLFGLSFPLFFDGAVAVFIGMIASRTAWAINALFFVWTIDFLNHRDMRYGVLASVALGVILLHPYHAIGTVIALALFILAQRLSLFTSGVRLAIVIASALALDAFWYLPLWAYGSSAMTPLIRATFDQTWAVMTDPSLLPYALLALCAVWRVRQECNSDRRAVLVVLFALPFVIGAIMLAGYAILIERMHVYQLDPVRLIGEFSMPILWLAAIGTSEIAQRVEKTLGKIAGWGFVTGVSALVMIPLLQSVAPFFPHPNAEPRFLSQATKEYRLDELWDELRASPGRILFTSHKTNLNARGGEPFPTTLTALAPLFTQRQIMGGTFTGWSPIAAFMQSGQIRPPVLWGLSDESDDRTLFGTPLEKLSDRQLWEYCRRFNLTTIVASVNDSQTRTFLDASPLFQSYFNNGFFFLYRVKGYESTWIEAKNATVDVVSWQDEEIVLRVNSATEAASVNVKMYAYPLWRATTDQGQTLTITSDDFALMQIALPRGENYSITLRYEPGAAEQVGGIVSLVSALGFTAFILKRLR